MAAEPSCFPETISQANFRPGVPLHDTEGAGLANKLSIVDYQQREAIRPVDSPRSLEACRIEGVSPDDLVYRFGSV